MTGVPRTGSIPAFVPTDAVLLRAAVGDVVSKFYDIGGRGVPFPGSERLMATPLDVLRKIPTVIAVAVGGEKVTGIRVGARAGFHRAPKHPLPRTPRLGVFEDGVGHPVAGRGEVERLQLARSGELGDQFGGRSVVPLRVRLPHASGGCKGVHSPHAAATSAVVSLGCHRAVTFAVSTRLVCSLRSSRAMTHTPCCTSRRDQCRPPAQRGGRARRSIAGHNVSIRAASWECGRARRWCRASSRARRERS
ncbi:hypothetical protein GCM10023148_01370 [Actinokineospora soli]